MDAPSSSVHQKPEPSQARAPGARFLRSPGAMLWHDAGARAARLLRSDGPVAVTAHLNEGRAGHFLSPGVSANLVDDERAESSAAPVRIHGEVSVDAVGDAGDGEFSRHPDDGVAGSAGSACLLRCGSPVIPNLGP